MPYVSVSDSQRISLLKFLNKNQAITMPFRAQEIYENPLLPATTKLIWVLKTSNQLEKPRFVIIGLQTNRKSVKTSNASLFDHCDFSNVKLFLNSQYYP